jgi:hypothetical protein
MGMSLAMGLSLTAQRRTGGGFDAAALDILRQFPSLRTGNWDDTEPTSDEWQAYVGNVVFGVWDDNEPTGPRDPSDEPTYTLWDDAETTT